MNDLFNKEKIIELFSQLDSGIYLNILKSVIIIFIFIQFFNNLIFDIKKIMVYIKYK